jgi:hypothetical protein
LVRERIDAIARASAAIHAADIPSVIEMRMRLRVKPDSNGLAE